ncbi:hypothetical protein Tco_0912422 [Tanacetum coccineum]
MKGGRCWRVFGYKRVTKMCLEALELKGGDGGACKLLGDVIEVLGCLLEDKGLGLGLSLRERMELDLEARLMGETLVLNRSLDPFFEDYIELNDLNEPFELRRNQGDDLTPTIEEVKVSEKDKMNGISHPYQKLKGFYKGVLNLGPDYIRDAKMEESLTRGQISVHEME